MSYLERAKSDLKAAGFMLSPENNPSGDERLFDIGAYHVSQAVEKCLKHILHDRLGEDDTAKSFKTHSINALISKVESLSEYQIPDYIKEIAALVTTWEADTRYSVDCIASKSDIEDCLERCERFIKDIETSDLL